MDYLNKLEKIRSAVSSSVSSTVFSTISTVKDVLPGNPVTRDFEVGEHIASGGPGKECLLLERNKRFSSVLMLSKIS